MIRLYALFSLIFVLTTQTPEAPVVDLVATVRTGELETNIALIDINQPELPIIPITYYVSYEMYAANNPTEPYYPSYLGAWLFEMDFAEDRYKIRHKDTGEVIPLWQCEPVCGDVRISPDGRFILFLQGTQDVWLVDAAREIQSFPVVSVPLRDVYWLNETQVLYWYESRYVVFDVETRLYYPLEEVLDPATGEIDLTRSDTPLQRFDEVFIPSTKPDLESLVSPDGNVTLSIYSDFSGDPYCDGCGVIDAPTQTLLMRLPGYRLTALTWSPDSTRFTASFYEITGDTQAVWLYDVTTGESRNLFEGEKVQWLN